jgi:hypothetical protein
MNRSQPLNTRNTRKEQDFNDFRVFRVFCGSSPLGSSKMEQAPSHEPLKFRVASFEFRIRCIDTPNSELLVQGRNTSRSAGLNMEPLHEPVGLVGSRYIGIPIPPFGFVDPFPMHRDPRLDRDVEPS